MNEGIVAKRMLLLLVLLLVIPVGGWGATLRSSMNLSTRKSAVKFLFVFFRGIHSPPPRSLLRKSAAFDDEGGAATAAVEARGHVV